MRSHLIEVETLCGDSAIALSSRSIADGPSNTEISSEGRAIVTIADLVCFISLLCAVPSLLITLVVLLVVSNALSDLGAAGRVVPIRWRPIPSSPFRPV
jgi:hypothetical protein